MVSKFKLDNYYITLLWHISIVNRYGLIIAKTLISIIVDIRFCEGQFVHFTSKLEIQLGVTMCHNLKLDIHAHRHMESTKKKPIVDPKFTSLPSFSSISKTLESKSSPTSLFHPMGPAENEVISLVFLSFSLLAC